MAGARIPELDIRGDHPIRVVVCIDQAALRRRLVVALEEHADLIVVGEESDSRRVGFVARELAPDAVLLDMAAEPLTGPEAVTHVRGHAPTSRVAVVGTSADEAGALATIRAGAVGFVSRDLVGQAAAVVRAVNAGVVALPPLVAALLRDELVGGAGSRPGQLDLRAAAVLDHVAGGRTYAVAADALGIAPATARNLVANAVERLARAAF